MYTGINDNKGIEVQDADAYKYMLDALEADTNIRRQAVEWFFSGEWVKREEDNK